MRPLIFVLLMLLGTLPMAAQTIDTSAGSVTVERMMDGLKEPWSVGFLPGGGFLVTERGGRLTHVAPDGQRTEVRGLPDMLVQGQGGLLDVMVPTDFGEHGYIFLSFAKSQSGGGAGTALLRGRLSEDGAKISDAQVIFEMSAGSSGKHHFGGRIVEAPYGTLFLTLGERGERDAAQDLNRHNGSIIHIERDGTIPRGNPFSEQDGALPEIWSYGHRNPQGAALDLSGNLWVTEHGAKGGDEVNRIVAGANYGWPVISYGRHYSGLKIGEGTQKPGMEQPAHYWDPSIAPSGLMIYSGKLWPEWRGDFFVGSLKFDYISRLDPEQDWSEEVIKSRQTGRVRDIREAPDGSIWFLSVDSGAIFRMRPK